MIKYFKNKYKKYKENKENRKKENEKRKIIIKQQKEYGCNILYPVNDFLDILLIYLNEVGVKELKNLDQHYLTIIFNDNTIAKVWDCNKWYAWMIYGEITFYNGKNYKWERTSPSYEVLIAYKKLLKYNNNNNNKLPYEDYLPLKLKRKMKLKKII